MNNTKTTTKQSKTVIINKLTKEIKWNEVKYSINSKQAEKIKKTKNSWRNRK